MSASNEATAYVYQHLYTALDPEESGSAYVYQNVGNRAASRIGAVFGMSGPHLTPIAYVYQNVT